MRLPSPTTSETRSKSRRAPWALVTSLSVIECMDLLTKGVCGPGWDARHRFRQKARIERREAPRRILEPVAELGQRAPARVAGLFLVRVRLVVQVPAADRAEAGAVRAAEDLVRELEGARVTRPAGEVEAVVGHVLRPQLLGLARVRGLVLAPYDRELEHSILQTPVARPVEANPERQLEARSRGRPADRELRGHLLGHGQVALAAQLEGLELELDLVAVLLSRPQLERPEAEA